MEAIAYPQSDSNLPPLLTGCSHLIKIEGVDTQKRIMNAVIAQHLNIAVELILEVRVWARVLWVRAQGLRPRFVSKVVLIMTESQKLQLTHYGRKGIYAYLCPLTINGSKIERGDFYSGEPLDEGDNKERYYRGKSATVEINLGKFDDGLYEYKEAVGHKERRSYLRVESGRIAKEWETLQEMMNEVNPVPELPELEGTPKQVSWAENIREKAVRNGFPVEKAKKVTSAKLWIDNRSKFNA